ncbi:MAG: IS110 family transposase, partial [Thermoplasmata archaeon]
MGCRASSTDPLGRRGSPLARRVRRPGRAAVIYLGIDWAEAHHDVCLMDGSGTVLGKGRVGDGLEGLRRIHELV